MYRQVPTQVDLPAVERDVLAFWADAKIFQRTLERGAGGPVWVFYEGPPTANGRPGTHHVEARVFKDLFPRFKTMNGYDVPRKAGWDCHGLPVELAVEKELGFTGKADIEAYGVAAFNARCRESVLRHVDAFEELTTRMGYWVDMADPYRTMDPEYVDSVWWSLKEIHGKGLLVEDYRITPYCPRCGTGLSDHELGQPGAYETVVDPSVYVRLPVTKGPLAELGAALLVWTTTPWTLVSNALVAVHPDVDYVAARPAGSDEVLVVAEPLADATLGEGHAVLATWSGRELASTRYRAPFDLVAWPEGSDKHFVVTETYVTTEDGSGLVHQSPAHGEDDFRSCREHGVPMLNPIGPDGAFLTDVGLVGGMFFKKADEVLVRDLEARGIVWRHGEYEHAYPHCWRCHTPLMYYALPSWYVRTTARKDALLRENERTTWYPEHIKWGRYGDWLRNNIDWSLSRTRYWGTPLPIWRNDEDPANVVCVGSRAELGELVGSDLRDLDPHRPFVDDLTFTLPGVSGTFRRVPEVIDAWYDSGSMPFAQWGYPYVPGSAGRLEQAYPAQFVCEALDQTRGWFYTLMAIGTLLFDQSPYEHVLCLGLIMAEDGRRMSKHLGNILEPIPVMEEHGADALRWFMACSGSPWGARRVGPTVLREIVRKVLLTYWNTASFLTLYARAAEWTPAVGAPERDTRPTMDRWALVELDAVVADVTTALEQFDAQRAGQRMAAFVDDLSNWYVRRSRRRFWAGDPAALATLHTCLETLTRLLAPITPFITERLWQDVVRPVSAGAAESVHLATWPHVALDPNVADGDDAALPEHMALVRRLVELGRAARAESGFRTRQPLRRALVVADGWADVPADLRAELAAELNVGSISTLEPGAGGEHLVDVSVKANFRSLGKRFGSRTPAVAAAVAAAAPEPLAAALRSAGRAVVPVDGTDVELGPEDVVVQESPREGWTVASAGGETLGLDLAMTQELQAAGRVRDIIRTIQEGRKRSGFEMTQRIEVVWRATDPVTAELMRAQSATIAAEVLASRMVEAAPNQPLHGPDSSLVVDDEIGVSLAMVPIR